MTHFSKPKLPIRTRYFSHLFLFACFLFALSGCDEEKQTETFTQVGKASFYADFFQDRLTSSGESFDQNKLTAAHKHLPLGTKVQVTNLENDKEVTVVINDRGPFVAGRIIDLSKKAMKKLDFEEQGVTEVKIEAELPESTVDSLQTLLNLPQQ